MATTAAVPSSKAPAFKRVGWAVMAIFAVLLFLFAARYLTLNPDVYFPQQQAVYVAHMAGITIHIAGAMLAAIIGPFQFLTVMSTRYVRVHRRLGRIYLLGVLVGGLGGLYMAFIAYGGFPARLGFASLAVLWLASGFLAYRRIRNRQVQSHRQWMVRNYALTFAAVTLRLWGVVFQVAGVEFDAGYVAVAWLSWAPNLLVAEYIVNRIRPERRALAPA